MTRHRDNQKLDGNPEVRGLLGALRAEYAAIFAYGLVTAYSRADRAELINTAVATHRARRDALIDALNAAGVAVPPADPGYTVPSPVTDPVSAAKLAVTTETDTAVAWRAALQSAGSPATRQSCIDALTECALRLARWNQILGVSPSTVAFPGQG